MNTTKKPKLRYKMVIRLWAMMLILTLFSVSFMWVAQIYLFEKNYINSTIAETINRLEPVMEDLKTVDLAYNDELIPYLSKSTNGKMMLIDAEGDLIAMYSNGYKVTVTELSVWHIVNERAEYKLLLQGEKYSKVIENNGDMYAIEIGIPVVYEGKTSAVIMYHSLDGMNTMLEINRNQLAIISILLAVASAILAAILARYFTKPIKIIKSTVDSMANGNLTATTGLNLKDEMGQLSDSVEELGQALQRVDILRKEVIANVSHELRAPLALISGYAEMVRDINWRNDRRREEDLTLIINESKRMSEMVSDIMDYSQMQAGYIKLNKGFYNLYEIIEGEIFHCENSAAEYNVSINLSSFKNEINVIVDPMKISQAIGNLIYNAINHTADGETIVVDITAVEMAKVRVSVINTGVPIPQEEREIIWERYQRCQHQGGRKKGTGIGLSIVSTFLKAHNMEYGVDCHDGYTTFWFECNIE